MLLQPDEELYEAFREGTLLITNLRVAREVHGWRHDFVQSIPLEQITDVHHQHIKYKLLLMLAGISVLSGILAVLLDRAWALGPFLLIAAILTAIYSFTRIQFIRITGEHVKIRIDTAAWSKQEVNHFLKKLDEARTQRLHHINEEIV